MNSRKTLTCHLFHLPQDIFRVIFQYLSLEDLMKGEEAFLNNQELLSLYRSSLEGFTLQEKITIQSGIKEKLIFWIIDHKLLVVTLKLWSWNDFEMDLLNQFRSSLKSINFLCFYPRSDNSVPVIPQLGYFPSLTSVTFYRSYYFTNDHLLTFFSQHPQLEIVFIYSTLHLSNEIFSHLSNYCPKIKILNLFFNDWVNDETISLLTQQRLFPNLKSLSIYGTKVTNQETLRQFILSRPLLSGLLLPDEIQYSDDFLIFYLRQFLFPSILRCHNDLVSHELAISSIFICFAVGRIFDGRDDFVTPEIFSIDILSHLYHKDCSLETLDLSTQIFSHLSKFPSMIDSILQSQFIPFILNDMSPDDSLPFDDDFVDLLCRCGVFHDHFPLLLEKYQTHPSPLLKIFHQAIKNHFSLLTREELQTIILIVLNKFPPKDSYYDCLGIISKIIQEPSSQLLIDPNNLLFSFNSIDLAACYNIGGLFGSFKRFNSLNENYQQLLIESNLLPQIMTVVTTSHFISFTNRCLVSSRYGLLVDHLVNSGLFQYLLSKYSQSWTDVKNEIESLLKRLIKFKYNKYSEMVREMELPNELRVKLY